jgi:hypothetical protein
METNPIPVVGFSQEVRHILGCPDFVNSGLSLGGEG